MLKARDTSLAIAALRVLGCSLEEDGTDLAVSGGSIDPGSSVSVDVGNPGTVMRFLPAVAALSPASVAFDGDPRARERPIGALLSALRTLGVSIDDGGRGALPFTIHGSGAVRGGAGHARRLRLVAARLRAAAGGGAVRPRRRGAPRGPAGAVAAAHRDDRADDRAAPAPTVEVGGGRATGLLAGPARAARPRGLHRRARPVQRGAVPGGGARHRRLGDDQGLAVGLAAARRRDPGRAHPDGRRRLVRDRKG